MQPPSAAARSVIQKFNLLAHPEGGFFKETYRSAAKCPFDALPKVCIQHSMCVGNKNDTKEEKQQQGEEKSRHFSTGILFCLPQGHVSHLHRIKYDEMWHWYGGGALQVIELLDEDEDSFKAGEAKCTILGPDFVNGQVPQYVVKGGRWFGSMPSQGSDYCFVGCTVSPGFDFADFELGAHEREALTAAYPNAANHIELLTLPPRNSGTAGHLPSRNKRVRKT